jgi:hypothetical protein
MLARRWGGVQFQLAQRLQFFYSQSTLRAQLDSLFERMIYTHPEAIP